MREGSDLTPLSLSFELNFLTSTRSVPWYGRLRNPPDIGAFVDFLQTRGGYVLVDRRDVSDYSTRVVFMQMLSRQESAPGLFPRKHHPGSVKLVPPKSAPIITTTAAVIHPESSIAKPIIMGTSKRRKDVSSAIEFMFEKDLTQSSKEGVFSEIEAMFNFDDKMPSSAAIPPSVERKEAPPAAIITSPVAQQVEPATNSAPQEEHAKKSGYSVIPGLPTLFTEIDTMFSFKPPTKMFEKTLTPLITLQQHSVDTIKNLSPAILLTPPLDIALSAPLVETNVVSKHGAALPETSTSPVTSQFAKVFSEIDSMFSRRLRGGIRA